MNPETTVKEIKPNHARRKPPVIAEEDKVYEYELVKTHESGRPTDKKTDKPLGSPYPPSFSFPNHGISRQGNWRYIEGQPSIWVKDQTELENLEKNEIHELLGAAENQLEFKDGKLRVRGVQKLRIAALNIQDFFEGNDTPYKVQPAMFKFRLNNPDTIVDNSLSEMDLEYDCMNMARNCTVDEMLQACFVMGIDINDQSASGLNRIKVQFLTKAKYDPKNPKSLEFFMGVMNNPATKISYIFAQGLSQGLISSNQIPGKLTWAKTNAAIFGLTGKIGLVDELTAMVIDKNEKAEKVMAEIEKQLT